MLGANDGGRRMGKGHMRAAGVVAVFVLGACVQIAGIDDPHPKNDNEGGTGGDSGGAGGTSGCTNASQCPGMDDDCKTRTCTNEICGFDYSTAGTTCNQTGACDGAGVCKLSNGFLCSLDEQCVSMHCVGGICCGTSCAEGASCATGQCVCPGTTPQLCSGVCKDLATDNDNCGACAIGCSGTDACVGGACANADWAGWPMPNPVGTGLPNPADYTVDAANGIVTDNVTKLMWQRDIDEIGLTWTDAKNYCANLVYGGFSDWRLPTAIELVSLVDFTKAIPGPTIDTNAFPNTPSERLWTSSPSAGSSSNAWYVKFSNFTTGIGDVAGTYRVRCVR